MPGLNLTKLSVEGSPNSAIEHLGVVLDKLDTVMAKGWQERLDGKTLDDSSTETGERYTVGQVPPSEPFPELSAKEYETLELLATTESYDKVIAKHFGISDSAVKLRLKSVYSKLGVDNRTQAVRVWLSRSEPRAPVVYYETVPEAERIVGIANTIAMIMSKRPD